VTLTLAEADRLWGRKHQELLLEFQGMLSSQAEFYEKQLVEVGAHTGELISQLGTDGPGRD